MINYLFSPLPVIRSLNPKLYFPETQQGAPDITQDSMAQIQEEFRTLSRVIYTYGVAAPLNVLTLVIDKIGHLFGFDIFPNS